jgi:hypothetical protein
MTVDQLKLIHPMPWAQRIVPNLQMPGTLVQVLDARGAEVPLLTMTEFVLTITNHLAAQPAQPQPQ